MGWVPVCGVGMFRCWIAGAIPPPRCSYCCGCCSGCCGCCCWGTAGRAGAWVDITTASLVSMASSSSVLRRPIAPKKSVCDSEELVVPVCSLLLPLERWLGFLEFWFGARLVAFTCLSRQSVFQHSPLLMESEHILGWKLGTGCTS